jgi:DNA-directed RNA polymerase subunit N (RpoN/RPB10)
MIIPIRCFSCNKVLADKYDYYINKVNIKNNDENDIDNNKSILDNLGINRICCRRHFISTVDMMNII